MDGTVGRVPLASGRAKSRSVLTRTLWAVGLGFIGVWTLFNIAMLVWVTLNSFRGGQAIFSRPFELPKSFDFINYSNAWVRSALGSGFFNSIVIVTAGAVVTILLAAIAAYALSRIPRKSAEPLTLLFALGLGVPLQAVIIPLWVFMNNISSAAFYVFGWWDDRLSLFLVYVATSLPFAVFLLTGFFRSLPSEVEEAASIDGAGSIRTFIYIVWPMARAGLTTAFILTVVSLWNETLLALVFITDNDKQTLPQALLSLYGAMQQTADWGGLFAGIMIVVVPTIIAFVFLGRRITDGMSLGIGK